ncbi:MAG: hypothetical protein AAGA26_03175 [Pseudomonadota bacterium]
MAQYRPSGPAEAGTEDLVTPFGITVPLTCWEGDPAVTSSMLMDVRCGDIYGHAVRVLRAAPIAGRRIIILDAGLGILPAIATRMQAERVIAFENDLLSVEIMKRVFAVNGLDAEALHGRVGWGDSALLPNLTLASEFGPIPVYDLPLILEEEAIDMLVATSGQTDPNLLRGLPETVDRVLIHGGQMEAPQPARDLMMTHLISERFFYDPSVSEGDALLFRRERQASSREAG